VELATLLAGLVESFRLRSGGSGPRFTLESAGAPATVLGSADRLTQAFENLIANAASFSPPGGTVAVSLLSGGGHAEVAVADDGPHPGGAPRAIFTRFFRGGPQARVPAHWPGVGDRARHRRRLRGELRRSRAAGPSSS
jgi:two-component system sensor histidine kinase ChvG